MQQFIITANDAHQTIIKFIRKTFKGTSLSLLYKLFRTKKIKLNGTFINDFKIILKPDDVVIVFLKQPPPLQPTVVAYESQIKLEIVYEDDQLLIVDKPHQVVIHNPQGDSLDLAVRQYLKINASYSFTVSHVHRLDKLTRGLVIYAKTKIALNILHQFWHQQRIIKKYLALLETKNLLPPIVQGLIALNSEKTKMVFTNMAPDVSAKKAVTKFQLIKKVQNFSWYELELGTGRKHQIRATCAYLKAPIVGDYKYGSQYYFKNRIMLFAYQLEFFNLPAPLDYLNNQIFTLKDANELLRIDIKKLMIE